MSVATFIPQLWSARLLNALENAHVAAALVNRDYEGVITRQGDTVKINTIGAITVKDYTKNTDIADPETLTTEDQSLVIDQSKYFNFQVDDVDDAQAAGKLVDTAMTRAAYALNDVSDAYILKTIAAGANSGNVIGSASSPVELTADNVYQNIVALRTKLDKANVPTTGRTLVVPPEVYALLLLDDRFAKSDAQAGQSALLNGLVGRVAGFTVYMSNNVSGTSDYFNVTAQVSAAATYAEQIVKTEAYRIEKRFADGVKGLHVYGAKVTDGKQIAKLICSVS